MRSRPLVALTVLCLAAGIQPLHAQCMDPGALRTSVTAITAITSVGSTSDDRRRVSQDVGKCSTSGELIRSARSMTRPLDGAGAVRWAAVAPSLDVTRNSTLPFSFNDGPQWAGRGLTTTLSGGIRLETDRVSVSIAPAFVYQQNRVFAILPSPSPTRSPFASPWHTGSESADIPLRFGNQRITTFFPGESWIDVAAGPVAAGASTDEQWWGPGIRNGLVMSNNAAGIPRVYLRSRQPLSTPIGGVEFRWILGGLTESRFFDSDGKNDLRSLSGAVVTLRTAFDSGLTVGVARSVYAPVTTAGGIPEHLWDVFRRWDQTRDTARTPRHGSDQLLSLFGRWVFPESGFEFYGEWATLRPPSLREMLVAPQAHQGYTLGLQWVNPLSGGAAFRLQAEATMLEQTPLALRDTVQSFYTSRFAPQGYTQRGQVIGAAIGPGSSSQFVAGDYLASRWRFGIELGRIRWEDEAYYRSQNGVGFTAHDVSIFAGMRGGTTVSGFDVDAEVISSKRLNYLFQNANSGYAQDNAFDANNVTLRLRVSPR